MVFLFRSFVLELISLVLIVCVQSTKVCGMWRMKIGLRMVRVIENLPEVHVGLCASSSRFVSET